MKSAVHIICLLIILLFWNCSNNVNKEKESSDKIITLNFSELIANKRELNLSEIAENVEYIKLETTPQSLLEDIYKIHLTPNYILISDMTNLFQFSREGNFIRKIGSRGKGPKEYLYLTSFDVNLDKGTVFIYCSVSSKLLIYRLNGDFCTYYKMPGVTRMISLKDSLFLAYQKVYTGAEDYIYFLTTPEKDTINGVRNSFKWEFKGSTVYNIMDSHSPFYKYNHEVYCKEIYNDTIYKINVTNLTFEPVYNINMGKYDMPDKKRLSYISNPAEFKKYWEDYYKVFVKETHNYLWLSYSTYNYNNTMYYGLYNKNKGCLTKVKTENGKLGIKDNMGGCVNFWPLSICNNELVDYIYPNNLKSYLLKYKDKKVKLPKKRRKLKLISDQSGESDNPIIRIVTLK